MSLSVKCCFHSVAAPILSILFLFTDQNFFAFRHASQKGDISLKVTPTSMLDFWGANLPVGIEYNITNNLCILAEAGIPLFYRLDDNLFVTINARTQNDMLWKATLKYYYSNEDEERVRLYIGAEVSGRDQTYHVFEPDYFKWGWAKYSFSKADVHRKRTTIALLWGVQQAIGNRLAVDGFVGIGLRMYNADFYNIVDFKLEDSNASTWIHGANHFDGNSIGLHFPLGVRLSFLLTGK